MRLGLAVAALAMCVAIAGSRRSEERCSEAGADVVRSVTGTASGAGLAAAADVLAGDCTDTRPLLVAASTLGRDGRSRLAEPLARLAVAREPENAGAWAALYFALRPTDPAGAARARERAEALNPGPGR